MSFYRLGLICPTAIRRTSRGPTGLYDNLRLVRTAITDLEDSTKFLSKLPQVRTTDEEAIPRSLVLAQALLTPSNTD